MILLAGTVRAQTVFWQDNFENASTPDIAAGSTRTPENNSGTGGPPNTSYFKRTNGSDISLISTAFSGFANSFFWAGEDHDTPFGAGNEEQQIEWTGINISGKTNLSFKGLFGANSTNGSWDNFTTGSGAPGYGVFASPGNDYIIVQYAIDGGAYTNLVSFFSDDITGPIGTAKKLKEDTNGDFIGDGTTLNQAMTEIAKNIPGTGSLLKIKIRVFSNGGSEEWAIDNFRVLTTPTVPLTLTGFSGKKTATGVLLNWQTAAEYNTSSFDIERSEDAVRYNSCGNVTAAGSGSNAYSFEDRPRIIAPIYYYRLKMIDKDGNFRYSPVLIIKSTITAKPDVYPNPATGIINISAANAGLPANDVRIYDTNGKLVVQSKHSGQYFQFDISQLATGLYWLSVNNGPVVRVIKN